MKKHRQPLIEKVGEWIKLAAFLVRQFIGD